MRQNWVVSLVSGLLVSCSTPPPASDESQITEDAGIAQSPVLSKDGMTIAFAAKADNGSYPQIWIRRVDKATAASRLTDGASSNYDPEFSADGKSVYFTSTREPQGIYHVPVTGGAPELVVGDSVAAKISPDGKALVYGNGGKVFLRQLEGGPAKELLPAIDNSYAPAFSPDGSCILLTAKNRDEHDPEWWIAQAAGGEPRKTSIAADLREQGFNYVAANAWLPGDWIVFTGRQGQTQTLWKVQIDPGGKILGKAVRASGDAEGDYGASFAAGKMAFARTRVDMNLWALPLDPSGERLAGPPERLTASSVRKGQESAAGGKLLYSGENGDRFSLYLKDGGKEKLLGDGFYSVLTPDGSRYAYGEGTKEQLRVSSKAVGWWPFWSSLLCENCGMPRGFSPDGKKLLLWSDSPPMQHIDLLDLNSRQISRVVWAGQDLSGPRLSPDGRWVSFVAKGGEHEWRTYVAPVSPDKPVSSPVSSFEWVPITPPSDSFHYAFWSATGDVMYILTARGGSGNLRWLEAQKLDAATKRPVGGLVPVHEFDEMLVPGMDPIWNTVSVSGNRIVLELGGASTNIWIK